MKKRIYNSPLSEVNECSSELLITGPASVLPGPGTPAPERHPKQMY